MATKTSFSCGEALDIAHVASLQTRLEKSLQKSSILELKAEAVEKVDTAGLQLIISIKKEVQTSGGNIIWRKPSEKLLTSAKSLGLSDHLGLSS
jgi:ABC-type transporter Mla MlaB component